MATSPYGGFADLSPYRARVEQKYYEGTQAGQLAAAIQESILQKNLQASDPNSAENKLSLAIQQANLEKLQRPEIYNTSNGLAVADPNSPFGFSIVPGTAPQRVVRPELDPWTNPIATDQGLVQRNVINGDVRPFTMSGAALQRPAPLVREDLKSPWGDAISSDQGMVQRNNITGKYRRAQIDVEAPVADDGILVDEQVITGQETPSFPIGRIPLTRTTKSKSGSEKAPPAKVQDQYIGSQNLFKTGPRLEQKIAELRAAGIQEPSAFEKAIINVAYQDPKGLISGLTTAIATGQIRPEIAELEQIRAEIESNYTTSKAGLSQTASEVKRTIPVAPTRFDSWDRQLSKTKNLVEIAGIHVSNVNRQYPSFGKGQSPVSELDFASENDVPEDLPKGTRITIGGRPAVWE